MKLKELIRLSGLEREIRLEGEAPVDAEEREVLDLGDDSRKGGPSFLYCVTPQGAPYLEKALSAGCRLILMGEEVWGSLPAPLLEEKRREGVQFLVVPDLLRAQGFLSSALHRHPSRRLRIVGVTGTNGKTSVAWMVHHIWNRLQIHSGMIGTLGVFWNGKGGEVAFKTGYTTPRAPELHSILARMEADGVTNVVMEVSSEALSLGRLEGCRFSVALFSNLTPDHLNYHGTMENYFQAKMLLLQQTAREGGRLVVYTGAPGGERAALLARELAPERVETPNESFVEELPVAFSTGFHRINASLAVLASGEGEAFRREAREALRTLSPIPGRFHMILPPGEKGPSFASGKSNRPSPPSRFVLVDYAHTPDALENLLQEVRSMGAARIGCLFGCGGDRDREKRPLMGEIAARLSHRIFLTDDNPRSEDPDSIREEIRRGIEGAIRKEAPGDSPASERSEWKEPQAPKNGEVLDRGDASGRSEDRGAKSSGAAEIPDRREAIEEGVRWLMSETELPAALVVAGKGHETVQIFRDHTVPFDDTEEVRGAFLKLAEAGAGASAGPSDREVTS